MPFFWAVQTPMLAYAQAHTFAHAQDFRNENLLKGVGNQLRSKVKQKRDVSVVEVEKWGGKEPEADAQKAYLGAREKRRAVLPLLVPPSPLLSFPLFFSHLVLACCCWYARLSTCEASPLQLSNQPLSRFIFF